MRLLPARLCEFCSGRVSGSGPAERSRAERGGLDRSPAPRRHVAQGEAARAGWDSAFRPPSCRPASAAFMVSLHHHTHTHTHTRSHTRTHTHTDTHGGCASPTHRPDGETHGSVLVSCCCCCCLQTLSSPGLGASYRSQHEVEVRWR